MPTVLLIRHASAGSRQRWVGPDTQRPLSEKGAIQAQGLADALARHRVGRVLSSPALRCRQTVEPLARQLGLEVETRKELREGSDPTRAIDLMERLAGEHPALCTHGDVMPEVVELLARRGMEIDGPVGNNKGSWWELRIDHGRFATARWHPPA